MTTSSRAGAFDAGRALTLDHPSDAAAVGERLLGAAREIGPVLRAHADDAEREGRLARPSLHALRDAGLLRMFSPAAFGGYEVDPVTCARVVEEVAAFDTAAAWALQAANTGAWWCSRVSQRAADEIFADGPDAMMAASFQPPHRAVAVPGGYRFTGRGPLASGVHDSIWVVMTGLVFDGDVPRATAHGPEMIGLVMRTRDVEIVDTWHSLGLRGTDSNDVAVDDLFVPESHAFRIAPVFEPPREFAGPLYRFPAIGSVLPIVAPIALAIARGAIDEVMALAVRKTPMGSTRTLRDRASAQAAIGDAEATLRAARALFYETMAETWRRTVDGPPLGLTERADLLLAGAHVGRSASHVVDLMHRTAGTTGVYARSRLERHFRDAATIRQHAFVSESRLETAGQVYLGVAPEFALVAL